jgi:hypothetical protein
LPPAGSPFVPSRPPLTMMAAKSGLLPPSKSGHAIGELSRSSVPAVPSGQSTAGRPRQSQSPLRPRRQRPDLSWGVSCASSREPVSISGLHPCTSSQQRIPRRVCAELTASFCAMSERIRIADFTAFSPTESAGSVGAFKSGGRPARPLLAHADPEDRCPCHARRRGGPVLRRLRRHRASPDVSRRGSRSRQRKRPRSN